MHTPLFFESKLITYSSEITRKIKNTLLSKKKKKIKVHSGHNT